MALCSLSTGRIAHAAARRRDRSSARRPSPALPCSPARRSCRRRSPPSTASSPAVPDDAQSTRSTSGMRGHRDQAVGADRRSPAAAPPRPPTAATATLASKAIGDGDRGRNRAHLIGQQRGVLAGGQRHDRQRDPRCASTTASALRPIDPVEPRIASAAFIDRYRSEQVEDRRGEQIACRSDRARRRGRESAASCPSRRRCA